ncbi:hypothetical protein D1872_318170 [compost metagenome]
MLQNQLNPLQPHAEADTWLIWSSEVSDKPVVASTPADRINGADALRLEFEGSHRVVI